jgi:hypothetical protein
VIAKIERSNAGGITIIPKRRNVHAFTSIPSLRRATSQSVVAREPVTDKFGPRSTPTSIALVAVEGSITNRLGRC